MKLVEGKPWLICLTGLILGCAGHASAWVQSGDTASPTQDRAFARECLDDRKLELCAPQRWLPLAESFGVALAEDLQAQGFRGARVYSIDGYGRDMPMVSVLEPPSPGRLRSSEAMLEVHAPMRQRAVGNAPELSRRSWPGAVGRSWRLRREVRLASIPNATATENGTYMSADEEVVFCSHASSLIIETLDDEGVARRVRSACGEDRLYDLASAFASQALRGFPSCNHLDPDNYRSELQQLDRCLILRGDDLVAAAEVLNLLDGPVFDDTAQLVTLLSPQARISDGTGQHMSVSEALGLYQGNRVGLYTRSVEASAHRAVVLGDVVRNDHDIRSFAATRQVWQRQAQGWRLVAMSVGPFVPETYPDTDAD